MLKGKAAFKELFEITDDEDKKAFAKVVNYFDEYISIVFMKNVHSGVLTTAQIYDFATIVDINGFFEANKPEELGFNKTHGKIAYYLANELKNASISFEKDSMLHSYTKTDSIQVLMVIFKHKINVLKSIQAILDAYLRDNPTVKTIHFVEKKKGKKNQENKSTSNSSQGIVCYRCREPGHKVPQCPKSVPNNKKDEYSTRVEFIWDSGSDAHVVNDMSYYSSFKEQITIFDTVDGGKPVSALGNGDVVVRFGDDHQTILTDVQYIPQSESCIFSRSEGFKDRLPTICGTSEVKLPSGEVIGQAGIYGKPSIVFNVILPTQTIFYVGTPVPNRPQFIMNLSAPTERQSRTIFSVQRRKSKNKAKSSNLDPMEVHRDYGHPNEYQLKQIIKLDGLDPVLAVKTIDCSSCVFGRMTMHRPKASYETVVTYPGEIFHLDICGPFADTAHDGSRYFLSMVDDFSRYYYAVPMIVKNEAGGLIREFINQSFAKFRGKNFTVAIRCDNAGEFVNKTMTSYMAKRGIVFQKTTPGSSHQNGTVEKRQSDLQKKVRSLLSDANMPTVFWPDALRTAVEFLNWNPTPTLEGDRPINKWNGYASRYSPHPAFGRLAYVNIPHHHPQSKFLSRAIEAVYLGPAPLRSAGRFYSHVVNQVFDSDQVMYHPSAFYFDKFWPQLNKVVLRTNTRGIQGIGGIPVLAQSRPQVSKSEYEDLFTKLSDVPDQVYTTSYGTSSPELWTPTSTMTEQSPISTDETAMEIDNPLVEASASPATSNSMQTFDQPTAPIPVTNTELVISNGWSSAGDMSEGPDMSDVQPMDLCTTDIQSMDPCTNTSEDVEMTSPEPQHAIEGTSQSRFITSSAEVTGNMNGDDHFPLPDSPTTPIVSTELMATNQDTSPTQSDTSTNEYWQDASDDASQVQLTATQKNNSDRTALVPVSRRKASTKKPSSEERQLVRRPKEQALELSQDSALFQSPWLGRLRPIGGKRMHVPDAGSTDTPEDQQQKHKQLRIQFLNRLVSSGGIYLTRKDAHNDDIKSEKVIENTVPMLMSYKSSLSESDIDWTPTLYSLAVSERERVPKSFTEAGKLPAKLKWLEACDKEMTAHAKNGTFKLVELPEGRTAIGCRWVFAIKDNGLHKARLVALAANKGLLVRQMDVSVAFLNGTLEEEIYMRQPQGYVVHGQENYVLKLKKSLYGLKQAPQVWHNTVQKAIMGFGFSKSHAEPCLYYKSTKKGLVMIALYVDDMLILGPNEKEIAKVQTLLSNRFEMKDLGEPRKFLGMNIRITKDAIEISLEDYIKKMIDEFDDELINRAAAVPASTQDKLYLRDDNDVLCDETKYRSLVGKFIYAANTGRPDIAYATSNLSKYLIGPTEKHYKAALKVLRYLKGSIYHSLRYSADDKDVIGYSDSDYASEKDRKSRSGIVFIYAKSPVMWRSKMQSTIATSTLMAELAALFEASREAIWIKKLFKELDIKTKDDVTQLWCDNKGTISSVVDIGFHEGIKHDEVRAKFVQEKIDQKKLKVDYISTTENVSDMCTKALGAVPLTRLIKLSGMKLHDGDEC
ncbi:hypothetical protein JCM33374_g2028 [Metschnikowia sp. JCM 33374]|nr:hypothetical protein JCM33374_g2028 [Metschnikowia sp. JCM 33374]